MKEIRFGIAGLGGIARRFAGCLNSDETFGVSLAAVAAGSDLSRAAAFAKDFGAARHYGSYEELADDDGVDVVYIATTHNFHYANAKMFLERGKNVICEKPFFLTRKEAEEIVALARSKKLFLMEAMWTRCIPSFRKAKEWVDTGRIGNLRLIDASFCFNVAFDPKNRLYNPETAGGSLYDGGVYPIEYVTGITGQAPTAVKALSRICPTGVDELTLITMAFPNGVHAQARCALSCNARSDAYIYGDKGEIVTYYFLNAKVTELYDADRKLVERFESGFNDGFCFEINHAAELLREGKLESPYIPLQDTIDCAEIFDKIKS